MMEIGNCGQEHRMKLHPLKCCNPLVAAIDAALLKVHRPSSKVGSSFPGLAALGLLLGYSAGAFASSTFYVTTAGDPGPVGTVSLRQAVAQAAVSDNNTVAFDVSLIGSTITLISGEIAINNDMTIQGPGATKLTISGNDSSRIFSGGLGGEITISGLTLTHGNAINDGIGAGGAIYSAGGGLRVVNSVVTNSQAYVGGGIAVAEGGSADVEHSHVSDNYAITSGGGISAISQSMLIVNASTVSGNVTNGYGGGIFAAGAQLMAVEYSLISANTIRAGSPATQGGGGIAALGVSLYANVLNSTITGNTTYSAPGGGIDILNSVSGGFTYCTFSTIAGNNSGGGAGNGIYSRGNTELENCIVADNANSVDPYDLAGNFVAVYTLIKTPGTATFSSTNQNIFNLDPQLSALADHGGPTFTLLPATTSPVINAGGGTVPAHDQRGAARPAGSGADIGAVERQYPEDILFRNGFDPP